jgi:hypothetical protein
MRPVDVQSGLRIVIENLEKLGIDYMIVGSVAGTLYGEPRLTNDMDIVLALIPQTARAFLCGFDPREFYLPPEDILAHEATRGGQTNLIHHASGVKVDIMFRKSNPHGIAEFERRRRIEILKGLHAWIAAPEDVIIGKLRFYREGQSSKHLTDIRGILANTPIDQSYLDHWITALDLESYWKRL